MKVDYKFGFRPMIITIETEQEATAIVKLLESRLLTDEERKQILTLKDLLVNKLSWN